VSAGTIGRDGRVCTVLGAIFATLTLSACARQAGAPVNDQGKPLRQPESEYREVISGDTLYSIAWESGRDYRELATWNGIASPYTIRLGQKIRLYPSAASANGAKSAAGPVTHVVKKGETLFGIATRYDVAVTDLASWNTLALPYTLKPGQTLRLAAPAEHAAKPDGRHDNRKSVRKPDAAPIASANSVAALPANFSKGSASFGPWAWPVDVSPRARANATNAAKGIDIAGKSGQPIIAAAPGTVVYQGSGLRGYGQLIIVKHNTDFLSAYAHCDKIAVREGNVIKRGQKIAEMGSTGTDRVKLHFEIRYRGNPVDPLDFLPKK